MRAWQLMTDVPVVHNILAYIFLALNIVLPGIGTVSAACVGSVHASDKTQIVLGTFQLLTSVYIFGWAWSIYWGILIVQKSQGGHLELRRLFGAQQDGNEAAQMDPANARQRPPARNNPYE